MATERPHILHIDSGAITASSSATDTIDVGTNESYDITELRIISATGVYTLEITDQSGYNFSNEAFSMPAVGASPNEFNAHKLAPPLIFEKGGKYTLKFTDTSAAANRVKMLLIGKRILT